MTDKAAERALSLLGQAFGERGVEFFAPLSFSETLPLFQVRSQSRLPQETRSVVFCLLPYYIGPYPQRNLSRYAIVDDYHQVGRTLLEEVCALLARDFPQEAFVPFLDSSPFDEVRCAAQAGLGLRGENGMVINPVYGSYTFIGEIATTLTLPSAGRPMEHCPNCGLCKRACPSGALSDQGFQLDRCRSHITQKKGTLTPQEAQEIRLGGFVWGCDVCNDVCPYNRNPKCTPIRPFYLDPEPVLTAEKLPQLLHRKAFAWRGKGVLLRNLELIQPQVPKKEETP